MCLVSVSRKCAVCQEWHLLTRDGVMSIQDDATGQRCPGSDAVVDPALLRFEVSEPPPVAAQGPRVPKRQVNGTKCGATMAHRGDGPCGRISVPADTGVAAGWRRLRLSGRRPRGAGSAVCGPRGEATSAASSGEHRSLARSARSSLRARGSSRRAPRRHGTRSGRA